MSILFQFCIYSHDEENITLSYIMNFKNLIKTIKPAEILVLVVFVLYLVFPIATPSAMSPYIESPLGLLVIFCITVSLFLYSHPALGVLYLLVAYTLLRRSAVVQNTTRYVQHTKSTTEKRENIRKQVEEATPVEEPRNVEVGADQPLTLEEEVVRDNAPVGRSEPIQYLQTGYKPVATSVPGASRM
jgi:hypothetical protein